MFSNMFSEKAMSTKRRIVRMMTLVAVLGFLGGGLAWAGHTSPGKIRVDAANCPGVGADGSRGNPFCTIQEAVDHATTTGGDHITVQDGIYQGNVEIPGDKHFLNLDADPTATGEVTIDCQNAPVTGLTVLSDGNIVEDFVCRNCQVGFEVSGGGNLI